MRINKKAQSSTNITILSFAIIIIIILVTGFKNFGADLILSDSARLDDQSKKYISEDLYGLNITGSSNIRSDTDIEQPPYLIADETQSNKDYSLEFQYGKDKSESLWSVVFGFYNVPYILLSFLGLSAFIPAWIQGLISSFIWIMISVAIYWFVRGNKG